MEQYNFNIQKIETATIIDSGIVIDPERINVSLVKHELGTMIRMILKIATQEETIGYTPINWFEHLKQTLYRRWHWLPMWLRRKYPVHQKWITAIHKFPELNIPDNLLGREFVHLRVIDEKELEKCVSKS